MATTYVHIGLHKTGSTAIQKFLYDNARAYTEVGVLYPNAGHSPSDAIKHGHHLASWSIQGRNDHLNRPVSAAVFDDVVSEVEASTHEKIILSSEEFSTIPHDKMREILRLGRDIKVIFYVRRQSDVVQGLYGTDLCFNGELRKIDEYVSATTLPLDFFDLAMRWADLVGKGNVIARVYNRPSLTGGDVVPDFCAAIGLPMLAVPSADLRVNRSLPWYACESIAHLWRMGMHRHQVYAVVQALSIACADGDASYKFMKPSAVKSFNERFGASNERFAREFLHLDKWPFPADNGDGDDQWFNERKAGYSAIRRTILEVAQFVLKKR